VRPAHGMRLAARVQQRSMLLHRDRERLTYAQEIISGVVDGDEVGGETRVYSTSTRNGWIRGGSDSPEASQLLEEQAGGPLAPSAPPPSPTTRARS